MIKRGKQGGPTHRMWVVFKKSTHAAIAKRSKETGYAVGSVVRTLVESAVFAGLLRSPTPTKKGEDAVKHLTEIEQYIHEGDQLVRSQSRTIEALHKRNANTLKALEHYGSVITDQATTIVVLQDALRELDGPFVVRDVVVDDDGG